VLKGLAHLNEHLAVNDFLMGATFTVADAYAFTVVNWCNFVKIDLAPYPNLQRYMERVANRPRVREALKAEGLVH
jgi:glutathione S-transferase